MTSTSPSASVARNALGIVLLLAICGCALPARSARSARTDATPSNGPAKPPARGTVLRVRVPAPSLEGNLLGDSAAPQVSVYLPASYGSATRRRYPVVYLLHGYSGTHDYWLAGRFGGMRLDAAMDSLVGSGAVREMIVVTPNAQTSYGGSMYTNSALTGNWEDFVTRDLVRYVDRTYRTLARRASRAVAGHSMGGYGALKLAMRHPELYGAVYAMSPCCLSVDTTATGTTASASRQIAALPDREALRRAPFLPRAYLSMAAAFSPHQGRVPFAVDLPFEAGPGGVALRPDVMARWLANAPLAMLPTSLGALRRVSHIAFDAGVRDPEIAADARAFSDALTAAGVRHWYEQFDGDHTDHLRVRLETRALPFLSRALAGQ